MDPSNYPADEMKEFVTTLHNNDQQYGMMIRMMINDQHCTLRVYIIVLL